MFLSHGREGRVAGHSRKRSQGVEHADSRRSLLKILASATGGGLLARLDLDRAAHSCQPLGAICWQDTQCCSDTCDGSAFRCVCATGETRCGHECVATQTDPDNCGGCATDGGEVCDTAGGEICQNGGCCTPCGPGRCCPRGQTCIGTVGSQSCY